MKDILLADDDASIRGFLAASLRHSGYSVDEAEDGAEAYAKLQNDCYTLLLTDIVMPHMDGLQLAHKARQLSPAPAILFITGFTAMASEASNEAQGSHVIAKPFHLKDIVAEVDKIFGK